MNRPEIERAVLEALARVAPEVDVRALDAKARLRDQVDLDSMDWLRFLVEVNEALAVDIPERDYRRLRSLEDLYRYVADRAETRPAP